jgi:hypothetical protein
MPLGILGETLACHNSDPLRVSNCISIRALTLSTRRHALPTLRPCIEIVAAVIIDEIATSVGGSA